MQGQNLLFTLLRAAVCGQTEAVDDLDREALDKAWELAQKHDLAHLVSTGLEKLGLLKALPEAKTFRRSTLEAVFRDAQRTHTLEAICAQFEKAGICYMPLKGAVLRQYYPQSWMRSSCDLDILVKLQDLEKAAALLEGELDFRREEKTSHDISMFAPGGFHLELHYETLEEGWANQGRDVMADVWQLSAPVAEGAYRFCMPDDLFYLHHIAHMARHFENGGCGIRPFLDIWVLNHQVGFDPAARQKRLEEAGLGLFAQAAWRVSQVWFSGESPDDLTDRLGQFILGAGTYGSRENLVLMTRAKIGGRLCYLFRRIFLPYTYLKARYPVLLRHRWLTPVFQVVRWVGLVTKRDGRKAALELKTNAAITSQQQAAARRLRRDLGL